MSVESQCYTTTIKDRPARREVLLFGQSVASRTKAFFREHKAPQQLPELPPSVNLGFTYKSFTDTDIEPPVIKRSGFSTIKPRPVQPRIIENKPAAALNRVNEGLEMQRRIADTRIRVNGRHDVINSPKVSLFRRIFPSAVDKARAKFTSGFELFLDRAIQKHEGAAKQKSVK